MGFTVSNIDTIFISHMHLDHIGGLIGLLETACIFNQHKHYDVYGPPGIKEYIEFNFKATFTPLAPNIYIHEYQVQ